VSGGLIQENFFVKISFENLRFEGHVYAVFMSFLNIILHYKGEQEECNRYGFKTHIKVNVLYN
jgi:hypothetical protein